MHISGRIENAFRLHRLGTFKWHTKGNPYIFASCQVARAIAQSFVATSTGVLTIEFLSHHSKEKNKNYANVSWQQLNEQYVTATKQWKSNYCKCRKVLCPRNLVSLLQGNVWLDCKLNIAEGTVIRMEHSYSKFINMYINRKTIGTNTCSVSD